VPDEQIVELNADPCYAYRGSMLQLVSREWSHSIRTPRESSIHMDGIRGGVSARYDVSEAAGTRAFRYLACIALFCFFFSLLLALFSFSVGASRFVLILS